jgi:hypothetical protein
VVSDLPIEGLRSGLGTLQVDLRHTRLPASGTIPLKIDAGVRRTLVALPHDRCVHVQVLLADVPLALRAGAALLSQSSVSTPDAIIFGDWRDGSRTIDTGTGGAGPTLRLQFASAGGELVVRDYPDDVDPNTTPDWPGYPVFPEERPDTTGTPKKAAAFLVREWRERRKRQLRSKKRIERLLPGPCAATEKK